jgi:hypothetical protein
MQKKLNSDLLTEQKLNEFKLNQYKKQFETKQDMECFLRELPYSDDFPR